MANKVGFAKNCSVPADVLAGDAKCKIDYFKFKGVVLHDRLSEVSKELDSALISDDVQIILIPGATGVGKTLVHGRKFQEIQAQYSDLMQKDSSVIPVLREEVRSARSHDLSGGRWPGR